MFATVATCSRRLRLIPAAIAMVAAMWAAIDLHAHDPGYQMPEACSICLLEQAATGGVVPSASFSGVVAVANTHVAAPLQRLQTQTASQAHSIRAPPLN